MTIVHHPSEETLVAFANASLGEGNSLVVATHLAHCRVCRDRLRELTEVGGALLDGAEPATVAESTRAACLARLDDAPRVANVSARPQVYQVPTRLAQSDPLALYSAGEWSWVGPGIRRKMIDVPDATGTRVFLLKADPGTKLPDHDHSGAEWTCVLEGAFRHDGGRFGPGDFDEADELTEHNPRVEPDGPCVCLVALTGDLKLRGLFGSILQPFVRF